MTKGVASRRVNLYRFAVLILMLVSCFPLTLLTDTCAEGSTFSGVATERALVTAQGGQLINCKVTSTTPNGDVSFLQKALSTLVMDVSETGLITAQCEANFVDEKYPGVNVQANFQARGE